MAASPSLNAEDRYVPEGQVITKTRLIRAAALRWLVGTG
jgi:hypothetical protein